MEKIKDFFYNINDLIIALLIIAVASYIILWKVDDNRWATLNMHGSGIK